MGRAVVVFVGLVVLGPSCARGRSARPAVPPIIDMSAVDPAALVQVTQEAGALRATWPAGDGRTASLTLDVAGGPLVREIAIAPAIGAAPRVVARALSPRFEITTGSRAGTGNVFFDSPADRPSTRALAALPVAQAHAMAHGSRATLTLSPLRADAWTGELAVHLYAESPIVHFEARLQQPDPGVAYLYDAGLDGLLGQAAFFAPSADSVTRARLDAPRAPVPVRYRAICAESEWGALALFPPPHAYFFPRDLSTNLAFVEAGDGTAGIRQAPSGGGAYAPWFDAPAGSVQRMDLFVLFDPGRAEDALARVRAYTHDDAFPKVPGRVTFTSHWHSRLTESEEQGAPNAPELVFVLKRLGVNVLHLAEFHFDAHWDDPGYNRLEDERTLFDLTRRYSESDLLLIPGEEGVQYLGNPAPGDDPGHWMLLFPKPVYFTWKREGAFKETIAPYGTVYHLGSGDDAWAMVQAEAGMAWTAHPRIKASLHTPDAYKDRDFFKDDRWVGATWKAMPADLSQPHLGDRSLALFDDMQTWGGAKRVLGEVDVFEVDRTHELYGYMNINYIKLDHVPEIDDWSSVMPVLRRGDFFTTTGEVVVHDFGATASEVHAELEWTLPLDHARVVFARGGAIQRVTLPLDDTEERGHRSFSGGRSTSAAPTRCGSRRGTLRATARSPSLRRWGPDGSRVPSAEEARSRARAYARAAGRAATRAARGPGREAEADEGGGARAPRRYRGERVAEAHVAPARRPPPDRRRAVHRARSRAECGAVRAPRPVARGARDRDPALRPGRPALVRNHVRPC
jgi:hypothetical protein